MAFFVLLGMDFFGIKFYASTGIVNWGSPALYAWLIFSFVSAFLLFAHSFTYELDDEPESELIQEPQYRTEMVDGVEVKIPIAMRMPMSPKDYR